MESEAILTARMICSTYSVFHVPRILPISHLLQTVRVRAETSGNNVGKMQKKSE